MAWSWLGKTRLIHRLGLGISAFLTGVVLALVWVAPDPLVRLENASVDLLFWLRGPRPVGQEIVLVTVDERSLKEVGRWPWPRDTQAQLVKAIAADGPRVIGLDIIYAEAEESRHLQSLRQLDKTIRASKSVLPELSGLLRDKLLVADTDGQFEDSLRTAKNVVLALPFTVPVTERGSRRLVDSGAVPEYLGNHRFMLVRESRSGEAQQPYAATQVIPPLKRFAEAALSLGHVYGIPERDGITRYEYLTLQYGGADEYYPSFPLELARIYLGVPRERMSLILGEGVRIEDIRVPTDQKLRMLIDFLGPEGTFPTVSATDVLHERVPSGTFREKAVVFGTAALGTYDQKATPFSANFPGVEKNATVLENIIHEQFVERTVWSGPLEIAMILMFGLGLGYGLPRLRALSGALTALLVVAGYVATVQYLFVHQGIWLGVVNPILTITLSFVSITVLRFMTEEQEKHEIRKLFTPYVGTQVVQELIKDPAKARQGACQRRELTMLFCDVVGFTTFCENRAVEEVVGQMNEYLEAMTDVVFRWNGTVIDFIGDEVYALWGAPLDQPDHVELAVKCALHMRGRLADLNKKWEAEGKPLLDNGIGLNTGTVLVASMGAAGRRMKFTTIGDPVNLASRVEGLTRKFSTSIMVTEYTAARMKELVNGKSTTDKKGRLGHVVLRMVASVKVKGKDNPVTVYDVKALQHAEPSRVEEQATLETVTMVEK